MFRVVSVVTCTLVFIAALLFVVTTCVDVANSQDFDRDFDRAFIVQEVEYTEQELIQFKIQFCQDSVYQHYLSRTGIELRFIETNYTEDGAPIVGIVDSDDERFDGPVTFRCLYGEVAGSEGMLTEMVIETSVIE